MKNLKSYFFLICFMCSTGYAQNAGAPTEEKLKLSFYILQKHFSLDNRSQAHIERHAKLIPFADYAIESALQHFPRNTELVLAAIRTLNVQGNFYLRTERFITSQHKLWQAKKLCEAFIAKPGLDGRDGVTICQELASIDPKLPALYAITLHHLGQIALYSQDTFITIEMAECYLRKALELRQAIDQFHYENVPDSNRGIPDVIIYKRVLGYVYLQTNRLHEAEQLYLDLLKEEDPFNQLITSRQLFKVYKSRGLQALTESKKQYWYKKAMEHAACCLNILEDKIELFTRVSSIYRDLGSLFGDEHNPFQDLQKSIEFFTYAKKVCPDSLTISLQQAKQALSDALNKLSQKERKEALEMQRQIIEQENSDVLKYFKDQNYQELSYEKLGDLYLEKQNFVIASAFYSNGASLTTNNEAIQDRCLRKLAAVEARFLKQAVDGAQYKALIQKYKRSLLSLRTKTKKLVADSENIQRIYKVVQDEYRVILSNILKDLMVDLGPPPTQEYAFIGFGSYGRGLATPYSDLEFAILLKNDQYKYYFKKLSELFHIRLNALGEAPIATFEIESLKWLREGDSPSGRGLMLDCANVVPHVPLFKNFELIGTPTHIATIFAPACTELPAWKKSMFYTCDLVYGDQALLEEYQKEVTKTLESLPSYRKEFTQKIIEEDLGHYYQRLAIWLEKEDYYRLKRDIYRPFISIIDSLAILHNESHNSPWQTIESLPLPKLTKELSLAILNELALLRLQTYIHYDQEDQRIFTSIDKNEKRLTGLIEKIIQLQSLTLHRS